MLRSQQSNIRAFVKFINTTERHVEVHWVNFRGESVPYKKLDPGGSCVINTYCTHPWIFICPLTGERLQVSKNEVFLPEAWFRFISRAENGLVSVGRQDVKIHLPLKSLRDICLWRITFLLHSKEDLHRLEIPNSLRTELLHVFSHSTKYSEEDKLADILSSSDINDELG